MGSAGASLSWVPWPPASSPPCQTSHSPDDRPTQHTAQCLKLECSKIDQQGDLRKNMYQACMICQWAIPNLHMTVYVHV